MRIISLYVLFVVIYGITALTIKVDPTSEECFYEPISKPNTKVQLQFQVMSGGFLDIDAKIVDPFGKVIHQVERETGTTLSFNANQAGNYKICFSNMMSTLTPKSVWFDLHIGDLYDPNLAKLEHLDPIEQAMMQLSDGLSELQNEQKQLKTMERIHRDTVENVNNHILWWSIFEIIMLVAVSLWQLFYFRTYLSSGRGRI